MPRRSPKIDLYSFDLDATRAAAQANILANDQTTRSRAECQSCGHVWVSHHWLATGTLRCERCKSPDTLRGPLPPGA